MGTINFIIGSIAIIYCLYILINGLKTLSDIDNNFKK